MDALALALLRLLLACALLHGGFAHAQAVAPDFAHGVHYTFERMVATRTVQDEFDRGRIDIVSYVYRPLELDRREVVFFSHGSTGGWAISPKEPDGAAPPGAVIQFFTQRGYTVVAPMRRGVNESSGHYVEECEFQAGKCTLAENTALFARGLQEAVLDSEAVLKQVVYGRLVPQGSRVLFSGISRGGFLSLVLAADHQPLAQGVVNFVGGWISIAEQWPADINARRMRLHADLMAHVGSRLRVPTLWVYGHRDPYYSEATTRAFFAAYQHAGGLGEYFFVSDPRLTNGHGVARNLALWEAKVDAYLASVRR